MEKTSSNSFLANQAQILKKLFAESSADITNLFLEANEEGIMNYDRAKLETYKLAFEFISNKRAALKYIPFQDLVTELQRDIDTTTSPDAEVEQTLKLDGLVIKADKKRLPPTFFERDDDNDDGATYNATKIKTHADA